MKFLKPAHTSLDMRGEGVHGVQGKDPGRWSFKMHETQPGQGKQMLQP